MLFGYARVSTETQKLHLQMDALLKYGIDKKNIYTDTISGSIKERPKLDALLAKLREGDTFITWKLDRVARSVSHLTKLINDFENQGIHFISIQEPFFDTKTPYGKFIFNLFSGIAQLERDIIIDRTIAGQEAARRRGVKIGRKKGLSKKNQQKAILAETYYRDEKRKLSISEVMRLADIKSKKTLYNYLQYQGRRNCVFDGCGALFWDKEQTPEEAHCPNHIKEKKELLLLEELKSK